MLEWYRPGFDELALMAEAGALFQSITGFPCRGKLTYAEAFQRNTGLDPHSASLADLKDKAGKLMGEESLPRASMSKDDWLNYLLAVAVEPELGREEPVFIYNYPASQCSLAVVDPGPPAIARRFELYYHGLELGNGFFELTDPKELSDRFKAWRKDRKSRGLASVPPDKGLLRAMKQGFPAGSGMAIGLDRLLMAVTGQGTINEVIAFPVI
jgi:lysyl-tRNA synthetase class 2